MKHVDHEHGSANGKTPQPSPVMLTVEMVATGIHGELADAVLVRATCGVCGEPADPVICDIHYALLALGVHHKNRHAGGRLAVPGKDF